MFLTFCWNVYNSLIMKSRLCHTEWLFFNNLIHICDNKDILWKYKRDKMKLTYDHNNNIKINVLRLDKKTLPNIFSGKAALFLQCLKNRTK